MRKIILLIMIVVFFSMVFPTISNCIVEKDKKAVIPQSDISPSGSRESELDNTPALVVVNNRHIAVLRGKSFGYSPKERAEFLNRTLYKIISENHDKEITTKDSPEGTVIFIGNKPLFTITEGDLAPAFGEDKKTVIDRAVNNLATIQKEAKDSRDIKYLLKAAGICVAATLIFAFIIFILHKMNSWLMRRFETLQAKIEGKIKVAGINLFQQVIPVTRWLWRTATWLVILFITYIWLAYCLRQFPQTRAWGESLGGYLAGILNQFGNGVLVAIPDFFAIAFIIIVFRILSQMLDSFFSNVAAGRVKISWLHPDVVRPTSRIARGVLWIFAFIMAYPYLPGSGTAAFKGVSVLLGIILSIGSSSIINQATAGMVLMYSRAFRPGDLIRFNDLEGIVLSLGVLSTKLRTASREEVAIPNAVLCSATLKNFSRFEGGTGAILSTGITIGYSTPWRKVHDLLIIAAKNTPGIAKIPDPFVQQRSLSDFYVEYQLTAVAQNPAARSTILSALHANIQDLFNESGEQIMSPHYEADPPEKVWVPKERWFETPAGTSK